MLQKSKLQKKKKLTANNYKKKHVRQVKKDKVISYKKCIKKVSKINDKQDQSYIVGSYLLQEYFTKQFHSFNQLKNLKLQITYYLIPCSSKELSTKLNTGSVAIENMNKCQIKYENSTN